jgi:hypothetical protein
MALIRTGEASELQAATAASLGLLLLGCAALWGAL